MASIKKLKERKKTITERLSVLLEEKDIAKRDMNVWSSAYNNTMGKLMTINFEFKRETEFDSNINKYYLGNADKLVKVSDIESLIGSLSEYLTEDQLLFYRAADTTDLEIDISVVYLAVKRKISETIRLLREKRDKELRNLSHFFTKTKEAEKVVDRLNKEIDELETEYMDIVYLLTLLKESGPVKKKVVQKKQVN